MTRGFFAAPDKLMVSLHKGVDDAELIRRIIERKMTEGIPHTETVRQGLRLLFERIDRQRAERERGE